MVCAPSGGQQIQQLVGRSDCKYLTELSGRYCGKSWNGQDTSRFGTAYIRRREASKKKAEIREREHRRASEEETCAVYEPVSSTVTVSVPSPF